MPAERPNPSGSSSSNRRSSKPLMEKRRRARINQSLAELKNLIVDSGKKENTRYNKLEKADILEMTVKHLQLLHRQKLTENSDSHVNKFRAGFNECVQQVSRFVDRIEGLDSNVRMRLINHLAACINNTETNEHRAAVINPAYMDAEASATSDSEIRTNLSIHPNIMNPASCRPIMTASTLYPGALPLVASRLSTGEIAFVLPAALMATGSDAYSHVLPLLGSNHHVTFPSSPDRAASVISNESLDDGGSAPSCSSSESDNNSVAEMPLELDVESVWRPW